MDIEENDDDDELISSQWPTFDVRCKACGSTRITLDNTLGWSETSGGWGDVSLTCTECQNTVVIIES